VKSSGKANTANHTAQSTATARIPAPSVRVTPNQPTFGLMDPI
jgi:hypothetical protein